MRMSRGRKKLKVRVPKNPGIPEYHKTQERRARANCSFPWGLRKSFGEKALFFTTCFSSLCDMNCLFNLKYILDHVANSNI